MFVAIANEGVKAKDIEKEILKTIKKIKNGDFEEKEIEKIKLNTKADFIFSLENSSSVSSLYGSYFVRGNTAPLFKYENDIEKLKKEDLVEVAKKYLTKRNSTTLILKKEEEK